MRGEGRSLLLGRRSHESQTGAYAEREQARHENHLKRVAFAPYHKELKRSPLSKDSDSPERKERLEVIKNWLANIEGATSNQRQEGVAILAPELAARYQEHEDTQLSEVLFLALRVHQRAPIFSKGHADAFAAQMVKPLIEETTPRLQKMSDQLFEDTQIRLGRMAMVMQSRGKESPHRVHAIKEDGSTYCGYEDPEAMRWSVPLPPNISKACKACAQLFEQEAQGDPRRAGVWEEVEPFVWNSKTDTWMISARKVAKAAIADSESLDDVRDALKSKDSEWVVKRVVAVLKLYYVGTTKPRDNAKFAKAIHKWAASTGAQKEKAAQEINSLLTQPQFS